MSSPVPSPTPAKRGEHHGLKFVSGGSAPKRSALNRWRLGDIWIPDGTSVPSPRLLASTLPLSLRLNGKIGRCRGKLKAGLVPFPTFPPTDQWSVG